MENKYKALGGLYSGWTPPPFFRGVLPDVSRCLKTEKHDAAVLLVRRKPNESGTQNR